MKEFKHPVRLARAVKDGEDTVEQVLADGHVIVKVPSYKERMKLMKDMGIDFKKAASGDTSGFDPEVFLEKGYDELEKSLVSMEIKLGDEVITDLEDLSHYEVFQEFLMEMAGLMMGGIKLGEKPSTRS